MPHPDPMASILAAAPERPTEVARILALPRIDYTDAQGQWTIRLRTHNDAPRLTLAQEAFLSACAHAAERPPGPDGLRGAVGLLGCGAGKTLCAQLAAGVFGAQRPLLLMPASLLAQTRQEAARWGRHYRLPAGDSLATLSYAKLSHPDSRGLLDALQPDLVILDEAHMLANPRSARWRRLWRYVAGRRHQVRVVVLSGTLTWARLDQMAHLLFAALRDWTPTPRDNLLTHWGQAIDMGSQPNADDLAAVGPLLSWAGLPPRTRSKEAARRAFAERMRSAPGCVVAPGKVDADVSLRMSRWQPSRTRSTDHQAALDHLDRLWELPDGTELVDAMEYARHARTLALGFYLRWTPGTVDEDWLAARRRWSGCVRRLVEYEGYDSPALATEAVVAGGVPWAADAWQGWLPFRDWPEPPTEVVWLDRDYPRDLVGEWFGQWAIEDGVVWVQSPALGEALGLPYHGQGSSPPIEGAAAASIAVHGKGWNGQRYRHHLVLEPPRSAGAWEQLLARSHRTGQTEDVRVWVCQATPGQVSALDAGLGGATYTRDTSGMPQRLLLADWEVTRD